MPLVQACAMAVVAASGVLTDGRTTCHAPPNGTAPARVTSGLLAHQSAQCPAAVRWVPYRDDERDTLKCYAPVTSEQACCALCADEPACAAMTFGPDGSTKVSTCWLKSSNRGNKAHPTHSSADFPGRSPSPAPDPRPTSPPHIAPPPPLTPPPAAPNALSLEWKDDASFTVSLDGVAWLASAPGSVSVTVGNTTLTSSTPSGGLTASSTTHSTGSDVLGAYEQHTTTWTSKGYAGTLFATAAKVYAEAVVFEQTYPDGASGTNCCTADGVSSGFPVFDLSRADQNHGYLTYGQHQSGWAGVTTGKWTNETSLPGGVSGTAPIIVFNGQLTSSVVISSFSNFMTHSYEWATPGTLSCGLMNTVETVPSGYSLKTVVQVGTGVNAAVNKWGATLRTAYNTDRSAVAKDSTLRTLGYSTDNGAFYYYNTEPNKNYEDTLLDVYAYGEREGLPYKYVLLDSWWYLKGDGGGVKDWYPKPDIFPTGLNKTSRLFSTTGWQIQAHNRFWAADNIYAEQNGGKYTFLIDEKTSSAVPTSQLFWDDFIAQSMTNIAGLVVYEQDWLDKEFQMVSALHTNATLARDWMLQMGHGADKSGIAIQYCMSFLRHLLQSVESPAVTQSRASNDYHPSTNQWSIGVTSIVLHALGLRPSKDNVQTTVNQSRYGTGEKHNRLEMAIQTLSCGPVAPSDQVGKSDASLIMRSCMANGTLLQPDRPATAIDSTFAQSALGASGPQGTVYTTSVTLGQGPHYSYVLSADLIAPYTLMPYELGYASGQLLVATEANATNAPFLLHPTDAQHGALILPVSDEWSFGMYTVSPVVTTGAGPTWVLQGEVDKWVGVSAARVQSFDAATGTTVVEGPPSEKVTLGFVQVLGSQLKQTNSTCSIGKSGTTTITPTGCH